MMNEMANKIDQIIELAFKEDLGDRGDITSIAILDDAAVAKGLFVCESFGVISGLQVLRRCFNLFDPQIVVKLLKNDGDIVTAGEAVAQVIGGIKSLLAVERTALNFLSHLSGIATITKQYVDTLQESRVQLKDTRKTTPGLRVLEKMAVRNGKGVNHRMGLFDGILIKDNHLEFATIKQAVKTAKRKYPDKDIEVEVETIAQVKEALTAEADILLLDNMDLSQIRKAVDIINGKAKIEVSGGINLDNIKVIANTGVDFVSTSAITMGASPLGITFAIN